MMSLKGLHGSLTTRAVFYTAVVYDNALNSRRTQPRPRLRRGSRPPMLSRYIVHESRQWHRATGPSTLPLVCVLFCVRYPVHVPAAA